VGPIEEQLQAELAKADSGVPYAAVRAQMALTLARALDEGAGLAVAAVNRELRAVLAELAGGTDGERVPALAGLSTPVQHPEAVGATDIRAARGRNRRPAG
jgi:hypothetical protein